MGALLGGGGPAWGVSLEMSCQAVKRHNLSGKRRAGGKGEWHQRRLLPRTVQKRSFVMARKGARGEHLLKNAES